MDTRQLLGLLLVTGAVLWLVAMGRRSDEETASVSEAGNSPQPRIRRMPAAAGLRNRSLLAVILLILGALLLVPWSTVLGSSDSTAPCCPPGALSGSVIVDRRM